MEPESPKVVPVSYMIWLFVVFALVLVGLGVGMYYIQSRAMTTSGSEWSAQDGLGSRDDISAAASGLCNVAVINLHGELFTYPPTKGDDSSYASASSTPGVDPSQTTIAVSQDIVQKIESVTQIPDIKAIVLDVDSGGGSPVGGEEIARALAGSHMPTVALIRDMGASAAYEASVGAERIFAHNSSQVGSIGVTESYNDYSKYNDKQGITYVPLYVGDYKELGNPSEPLSKEGKKVLMDGLQKSYEQFVTTIATFRKLPYQDVQKLANGLTFDSTYALQNHLIDEIGGRDEVRAYLTQKIGEPASLCPNW